jgi:Putative prokaryotic signal transducing protein
MPDTHLIVIHSFATEMEAVIAKRALESAGIAASIQSDSAGGMAPHLGWATGGFKVLVPEEDEDTALEILELADE